MKTLTLLCIIIISLIVISCNNEPICDLQRRYNPQELKDYCDFPVGSYWIYRDSISGAIDSVYLFNKTRVCANESDCNECPPNSEDLHILVNEDFTDYLTSSYFADTFTTGGASGTSIGGQPTFGHRWAYFLFNNLEPLGKINPTQYYRAAYLAFHDSLQINSIYYQAVKVYIEYVVGKDSIGSVEISRNYVHYFSKKIGLIKYHLEGSYQFGSKKYVWELIRYHINK